MSISSEESNTSIVEGAVNISEEVADNLRREIPLPEFGSVIFSAGSIDDTFKSLREMGIDTASENVTLAPMNTKLSFIGATLFALHEKNVRLVYAVPEKYNPHYSTGIGEFNEFDITGLLKAPPEPNTLSGSL